MPAKRSRPAAPSAAAPSTSAVIGYARTSTIEQMAGIEAQKRDLRTAGCTRIFAEQVSSAAPQRPQLTAALDHLRTDDVLVVTKRDRLARSTPDLLGIMGRLNAHGIGLRILSMGGGGASPGCQLVR